MLASVASVKTVGDQLWVKVLGPPSCGKSVLCEALAVNREHILAKSAIRGFHSGYIGMEGPKEDYSLVSRLYDKTLVTKDGDTLLQSPNLGQILSEARDLYDCTARPYYRNAAGRDYEGVRMTWILCGTASLRKLDTSELGERFLDCIIQHGIDEQLEDEIAWRVVNRADRNVNLEANGRVDRHYEPAMVDAMQLTAGYIDWLKEDTTEKLVVIDNNDGAKKCCARWGKFIANMRARPSYYQSETAERECAYRLCSQLVRLSKCLALVLNQTSVNDLVLNHVHKVVVDTSHGKVLKIVRQILREGPQGGNSIAVHIGSTGSEATRLLLFMKNIGIVKAVRPVVGCIRQPIKWDLTKRARQLCTEVLTWPSTL